MKNITIGDMHTITLPEPLFDRCGTVFEALKMRETSRSINDKKVSLQILSDILWAAQGVNRTQGPFGGPGRRVIRKKSIFMLPGRKEPICMNLAITR